MRFGWVRECISDYIPHVCVAGHFVSNTLTRVWRECRQDYIGNASSEARGSIPHGLNNRASCQNVVALRFFIV